MISNYHQLVDVCYNNTSVLIAIAIVKLVLGIVGLFVLVVYGICTVVLE